MQDLDVKQLLNLVVDGDEVARDELLSRHERPLCNMIAAWLDPRVAKRVDESDILQESMALAAVRLEKYANDPPIEFFPWLRQIVREQIITAHRRHLYAQNRSVAKEDLPPLHPNDDSMADFAQHVQGGESTPSVKASRNENREIVKNALSKMSDTDRQVLSMRFIEQLKMAELANLLEITEASAKSKVRRALERLNREIENLDV